MSLKDAFDKTSSALGLVALSPLFVAVSAINLFKFKANPFYSVTRQGQGGEPFEMLKFRTMREEVGDDGELLPDEDRTTKWGKILRATSIDELPQLINIVKGDMSIVGPRPLTVAELETKEAKQYSDDILSVKPGLTGPWQTAVIGAKESSSATERLQLDASYAKHKTTLWGDLMFIIQTIPAFFRGHDGEYLKDEPNIILMNEDKFGDLDKPETLKNKAPNKDPTNTFS